ncbi:MAG: phosphoglucomutase/phosphomannomutase family protein, partial [Candidatus Dormibacteraeota bacterium]|nr:phosphoglucomutase/phosphomannomutase family protein [Candidatus Dormibacteraeota bacterium]
MAQIKFGTDGWRGVIADDFTFANLRLVAQGVAEYLKSRGEDPLAVIGFDCRFGAEAFSEEVAKVFAGNGLRTLIFNRPSPTQVASWTVIDRHAAGAVAITASHNPYLFNGVKYKPETGSSAPTEVIAELESRIAGLTADSIKRAEMAPLVQVYDPMPSYLDQVGRMVDLTALRGAGLSVLHECMHGSGYGYVATLLGGGSTRVTELHAERNPYFGGVNPEPITPNLEAALATMKVGGHNLCIATDGDADRVGIIDEKGRFINQLQVYALLMLYLFEVRGWRGPVVKTVNMTSMADKLADEFKVAVYEIPVGFKNVAPKMMETDAVLGGEESGGFGFRGHIPERDGILAGLFFADMILRYDKPLSEILADLERRVGAHAYARRDIHMPRESYERDREVILRTMQE